MWVEKLDLVQWRNHLDTHISFSQGVTIFVGSNGQGKTNIVEALRYLATLSSHRVSGTSALIHDAADTGTIHAVFRHHERTVDLAIAVKRKGSSEAFVNSEKAKVSDIPLWASVVLFAPEDSAIVRGEPNFRRQFMDDLVVAGRPQMSAKIVEFERIVKQRNSALKALKAQRQRSSDTVDMWNESFVNVATEITMARVSQLNDIKPLVRQAYSQLATGDAVDVRYVASAGTDEESLLRRSKEDNAEVMTEALERQFGAEVERGMTLVGPHRDDLELLIDGKPARTHASQGETWSLALALRLATAEKVRSDSTSGDPIVILDDVFAELDARRRSTLVSLIEGFEQIVITSAVEEDLPAQLSGTVWDVEAGRVDKR